MESSVIPDEAIRFRILANSNSPEDQEVKREIRDAVRAEISTWVENYQSIDDARKAIRAHLPEINRLVERELQKAGVHLPYRVEFKTVAFPTKLYGNMIYPAGNYEAVLITLGEGLGSNWWCVLFPPLCFLDIDSGEAVKDDRERDGLLQEEKEDEQQVEVKFFVTEWVSDLWNRFKTSL